MCSVSSVAPTRISANRDECLGWRSSLLAPYSLCCCRFVRTWVLRVKIDCYWSNRRPSSVDGAGRTMAIVWAANRIFCHDIASFRCHCHCPHHHCCFHPPKRTDCTDADDGSRPCRPTDATACSSAYFASDSCSYFAFPHRFPDDLHSCLDDWLSRRPLNPLHGRPLYDPFGHGIAASEWLRPLMSQTVVYFMEMIMKGDVCANYFVWIGTFVINRFGEMVTNARRMHENSCALGLLRRCQWIDCSFPPRLNQMFVLTQLSLQGSCGTLHVRACKKKKEKFVIEDMWRIVGVCKSI